ncbi:hypothetical protein DFH29DRAFT_1078783 [Suillus ampliporus]|nr:hypothetical protein DFH29DRAFT_1078783 [Suillus ampliporus]
MRLEQHNKLRGLLDVLVFIDTCVRNGLYAEALSLTAYASSASSTLVVQTRKSLSDDEECIQDFCALLLPLISQSVVSGFARDVRFSVKHEWSAVLAQYITSRSKPSAPSIWLVTMPNSPPVKTLALSPSNAPHSPPQVLTAFLPLAKIMNAYIRALNRLRMLAPVDALSGIVDDAEEG